MSWGALVVILLSSTPAAAQAPDTADPPATPATVPASQPDEPATWRFAWKEHPSLFIGADTRIDFRARLQTYVRDSDALTGDERDVDIARRRIGVEGVIRDVL